MSQDGSGQVLLGFLLVLISTLTGGGRVLSGAERVDFVHGCIPDMATRRSWSSA